MKRRTFIKSSSLASLAFGLNPILPLSKTHIISLSFDDGFKKSFYKIASIYEEFGLKACLNVIATGHFPTFKAVDDWILPELMGSFEDWNLLNSRGHEIMPHSWKHLNLARQPLEEAKELIDRCLEYFEDHLEGFDASKSVFNFPFNSSTPEIEKFALSKVLAIRSGGTSGVNNLPVGGGIFRQSCWSNGPNNIDKWVDDKIDTFLSSSGGWLILNTHGLDKEGWGPISEDYLRTLLARLVEIKKLAVLPVGEVLLKGV